MRDRFRHAGAGLAAIQTSTLATNLIANPTGATGAVYVMVASAAG
jgi:hypothetical protein